MKALYKNKTIEVWEISKTGERPEWVVFAFKSGAISWTSPAEKEVRVLMNILSKSSAARNFLIGGYSGAYAPMFGKIGDVIDLTNGQIITAKKFAKKYEIVRE